MSGKATGAVWDMRLEPILKFVLLAYADHADHDGKNVFPSIALVARKTQYSTRQVQRLTRRLEELGYLVDEGSGPRGERRWSIARGDTAMSGVPNLRGDTSREVRGDKSGSDLDKSPLSMSPELNGLTVQADKENRSEGLIIMERALDALEPITPERRRQVRAVLRMAQIEQDGSTIHVKGLGAGAAGIFQANYKRPFERALVGVGSDANEVQFHE